MPPTKRLIYLEHVNLKIPYASGQREFEDFFVRRLGAPECPSGRLFVAKREVGAAAARAAAKVEGAHSHDPDAAPLQGEALAVGTQKQMHCNFGLSQLHVEWCTGYGMPYDRPQRIPGSVTLAVDDLDTLMQRMAGYPHAMRVGDSVITLDPWGNTWVCVAAHANLLRRLRGDFRAGGVGHVLALLRLDLVVRPGVAATVARFYHDTFGAAVRDCVLGKEVLTEMGQVVAFHESAHAPPPDAYDRDPDLAIHVCFYVDPFESIATDVQQRGLFWVNPAYVGPPINDNVVSVADAHAAKQFRMKRVGPEWVLEHEIRSFEHKWAPKGLMGRL